MINPNKTIYDVFLVSIYPQSNLNPKLTKQKNIKQELLKGNITLEHRIMVQETQNEEEFKEIITGEIFPSTIIYNKTNISNDKLTTPLFIKPIICDKLEIGLSPFRKTYRKYLKKATSEDLQEYLTKNDKNKLQKEFQIAKNKSKRIFENNLIDKDKEDQTKIKRIIREYNRRK